MNKKVVFLHWLHACVGKIEKGKWIRKGLFFWWINAPHTPNMLRCRIKKTNLRRRVRSRGIYHSAMVKIEISNFSYFNIFSSFLHKSHLLQVNVWYLHQNQNLMDASMVYHTYISLNLWKIQFCHVTYGQLEEWICIENKDIKNPKT